MKGLHIPLMKPNYLKLILLALIGVFLIVAGNFVPSGRTAKNLNNISIVSELKQYQDSITAELKDVISAIEGTGEVRVSIILETGPESIYVTNKSITQNSQSESTSQGQVRETVSQSETSQVVTGRSSNNDDNLILEKIVAPQIAGCVIVAQGAVDSAVKTNIYRAVQVLLDIPIYKIEVLPMKGGK